VFGVSQSKKWSWVFCLHPTCSDWIYCNGSLLCAWCVHMMQLVPGCGTMGTIRSGDSQLHCQDMVH